MSLARDALASGDMVMAESYLQHAEHYNRIIMAAQSQLAPQHNSHPGEGPNGGGYRPSRWNTEGSDDDGGSDFDTTDGGGGDVRETQGGGGQDRERHAGNREHHGGGRDRGRHGGNGRETGRDTNGSDQPESAQPDESAPDQVS
jgi:hypothetical protein